MRNTSKYKIDISILICIILCAVISVITIGSAQKLLTDETNLVLKQIIWYGIGFCLVGLIMFSGNKFLYKNAWVLYIVGVLSLILVLFFGSNY